MIVIQGNPGTGKTVVAIYMIKLLVDIKTFTPLEDLDNNLRFSNFFTDINQGLLQDLRIDLVVPQQSFRTSIKKVFRKTPELHPSMVLIPFDLGQVEGKFDILLVDEIHQLNQHASQALGVLNANFSTNTRELFDSDDASKTQLD